MAKGKMHIPEWDINNFYVNEVDLPLARNSHGEIITDVKELYILLIEKKGIKDLNQRMFRENIIATTPTGIRNKQSNNPYQGALFIDERAASYILDQVNLFVQGVWDEIPAIETKK